MCSVGQLRAQVFLNLLDICRGYSPRFTVSRLEGYISSVTCLVHLLPRFNVATLLSNIYYLR